MSKWTIFKGFHISTFLPKFYFLNKREEIEETYKITFNESCRYTINEKSCVNKLFGYCFGLFQVHKNSVRFGWTYSEENDKVIIWIYTYQESKLNKFKIYECEISGKEYEFSIKTSIKRQETFFYINGIEVYKTNVNIYSKIIATLGFYFGGKTRAPHKIKIDYK